MTEFKLQHQRSESTIEIQIEGPIDESADFPQLDIGNATNLNFDLGGISHINSCGIRKWVTWMWSIEEMRKAAPVGYRFQKMPLAFSNQLKIIGDFIPKSSVIESAFVALYCNECDEQSEVLAERGRHYGGELNEKFEKLILVGHSCPSCAGEMLLDIPSNMTARLCR